MRILTDSVDNAGSIDSSTDSSRDSSRALVERL
jgi:hypothetical protein